MYKFLPFHLFRQRKLFAPSKKLVKLRVSELLENRLSKPSQAVTSLTIHSVADKNVDLQTRQQQSPLQQSDPPYRYALTPEFGSPPVGFL